MRFLKDLSADEILSSGFVKDAGKFPEEVEGFLADVTRMTIDEGMDALAVVLVTQDVTDIPTPITALGMSIANVLGPQEFEQFRLRAVLQELARAKQRIAELETAQVVLVNLQINGER